MRVVVAKQDLSKVLSVLNKVADKVDKKSPIAWFKLSATGGFVVEAKNSKMHIRVRVDADVLEEGEACVVAGVLLKMVQSSKSKFLELRTEGDEFVLIDGGIEDRVKVKPLEKFPAFPKCEYEYSFPVEVFREAVEKVGFAVNKGEDSRTNQLNNIFIHGKGDYLNFVGCDWYQLAVLKVNIPFSEKIYIYNQAVEILPKLLKTAKGDVKIGKTDEYVCLAGENFELMVRVDVLGDYPDYESLLSLLSLGCGTLIELYSEDLRKALEKLKKELKVVFELSESDEGFKLKYKDEFNEEKEVMVRGRVVGKNLTIAFKPKQLLEFLSRINHYIHIKMTDEKSPAVFVVVGERDYVFVVMPIPLTY
jgi:DNA polymerase III sliding clamp (beta) subunit (PCNA family)